MRYFENLLWFCLLLSQLEWSKNLLDALRESKKFSLLLSPLFLLHPFSKQPGVKIPFLNSRTSAHLLVPSYSISKLLNCSLSSCVGFLHLFFNTLQYILVAKKKRFWMTKESLNYFILFSPAWGCVYSNFNCRKNPEAWNETINPLPKNNCHTAYHLSWHPHLFLL